MQDLLGLIYFCALIAVGYFVGTAVEKKHYQEIESRESDTLHLPIVSGEEYEEDRGIAESRMVYGSVVISTDYFRLIVAGLRNLLGGEVSAYETLLDRGRREALLRMKEKAIDSDIIVNMRVESCQISRMGVVEVLAYGTALYYRK
jgi:uncharacterized protein YbjQ (UPF0145 family)